MYTIEYDDRTAHRATLEARTALGRQLADERGLIWPLLAAVLFVWSLSRPTSLVACQIRFDVFVVTPLGAPAPEGATTTYEKYTWRTTRVACAVWRGFRARGAAQSRVGYWPVAFPASGCHSGSSSARLSVGRESPSIISFPRRVP